MLSRTLALSLICLPCLAASEYDLVGPLDLSLDAIRTPAEAKSEPNDNPAEMVLGAVHSVTPIESGHRPNFVSNSGLGVVQVASNNGAQLGKPERPHLALKFNATAVTESMRSMGVDVSDCIGLARMPSKLNSDGGPRLKVSAIMNLHCKY